MVEYFFFFLFSPAVGWAAARQSSVLQDRGPIYALFVPTLFKGFTFIGFQVNGCALGSAAHTLSRLHKEHFSGARTLRFQAGSRAVRPCFIWLPPARQELRLRSQAGKRSPKKEKKMGRKFPLPPI